MDIVTILKAAVQNEASDIFITSGRPPTLKIDDRMVNLNEEPLSDEATQHLVHSAMNDEQKQVFFRDKECNFAVDIPGLGRFRASALYQRDKIAMVLRYIKKAIPTIE